MRHGGAPADAGWPAAQRAHQHTHLTAAGGAGWRRFLLPWCTAQWRQLAVQTRFACLMALAEKELSSRMLWKSC